MRWWARCSPPCSVAVSFLGWTAAGLPFLPFDLFDWIARILPGSLVTAGIESTGVDDHASLFTRAVAKSRRRKGQRIGGRAPPKRRRRRALLFSAAPTPANPARPERNSGTLRHRPIRRAPAGPNRDGAAAERTLGVCHGARVEPRVRVGPRSAVACRTRRSRKPTGRRARGPPPISPAARRLRLRHDGGLDGRRRPVLRAHRQPDGHALVRHARAAECGCRGHAARGHAPGVHAALRPPLPRRHEHARAADRSRALAAASRRDGPASTRIYAGPICRRTNRCTSSRRCRASRTRLAAT